MKAYLIARVSTEDQEDALPAQVYRLRDYARRNNFQGELYELQESAYKDGRKLFGKVVDQIAAEIDKVIVVFDKIDRYSRDSGSDETRVLRKLCKAGKLEIHFPSDSLTIHSTSPAQAWFMLGMGETTAEYYSRSVSDNVRRRFEQMRRDGLWAGKAPFGYKNIDLPNGKKWIELDVYNSQIVKNIYDQYATGVSSLKIIRKQIKTTHGVIISNAQLNRVLHNPFYKGEMRVNGELYPHKYVRIISDKLYDQVEAVRQSYKIKPTIYAGLPYPYRGLIICSECGCRITFEKKKGKYVYGHCTQTRGKHGAAYVSEIELTKRFTKTIQSIAIPDEAYAEVSQKLKVAYEQDMQLRTSKINTLDKEIKKYDIRLDKMYDDRLDGKVSEGTYDKKYQQFTESKQALVKRRNRFELIAKDDYSNAIHLLKLSRNAPRLFKKGKIEQKRELIKMTHSNLELRNKELRWKLKKPFDTMAICNETQNWLGRRFWNQTFEGDITEDKNADSDIKSIRQLLDEDKPESQE